MTVLITGGSGLLGSELIRWLVSQGERPVALDIMQPGQRLYSIADAFDFVLGTFADRQHLLKTIKEYDVDTLFHLGGMLSVPCERDPEQAIQINVLGTFEVLEAARLANLKRVIFSSSIAVYGLDLPDAPVDDHCLQRPTTVYGICKSFCEQMGLYYFRRYGLDFRGVRVPSVVAPGCRVAHMSIYNCWAIEEPLKGNPYRIPVDPSLRCPTIYYKDVIRALLMLSIAESDKIETRIYNLAGQRPFYSAQELYNGVLSMLPNADLTFEPDEKINAMLGGLANINLDDGNACREWGWRPEFDLEKMLYDFNEEFTKLLLS